MTITTDGPALPGPATYVDTAVVLVDLPLPTTYDFCSIVSVDEIEPTSDAVHLWPDPVAQGLALNIQSTIAADLTIFDTRGRVALRNNELLATRVVNTASLAKGTYMAVGCDKKGVRLWSRPFVVL
ncbi:MAG: T9SS type A sorting domain-containing protein [Flavobacteriales bacterium]|nr:T9SS type A sorting domain-containing protein [Flavobacteriales bacterium]